jgi:hypothetical protein
MQRRSLIFVVISMLTVVLVYSPSSTFSVPNRSNDSVADCKPTGKQSENGLALVKCCWKHTEGFPRTTVTYCSTCEDGGTRGKINCTDPVKEFTGRIPSDIVPPQDGVLEQPPTPPESGPVAPLKGGILEQLEQGEGLQQGFFEQQQQQPPIDQGAAQLPPATEGSQPAPMEEEPQVPVCQEGLEFNDDLGFCVPTECPEGQELNEETGICVLEEEQPAAAEQPEEQEQQTEEEQPSEESGSEEDNSNN